MAFDRKFQAGRFNSWKFNAGLLVIFVLGLISPLSSSVPLVAVYFPGAFIAMSIWGICRSLGRWGYGNRPMLTILPVPLYLIAASATLFVALGVTGEAAYRRASFVSLIMTIPFGLGGLAVAMFYNKMPVVKAHRAKEAGGTADPDEA